MSWRGIPVYFSEQKGAEVWESTFETWAQGPVKTEQEKCANAETAIKKAISAHAELSSMDISVFAQGSYYARTNIKLESDVDVCVRLNTTYFCDYPKGKEAKDYGLVDSETKFPDFKSQVHEALNDRFGSSSVVRGNKAFDVHANSYRVDADVVPTFTHRRYVESTDIPIEGVAFRTDDTGTLFKNWPDQTYDNGIAKNDETSRRYKRIIRILKNLRNHMQKENISAANDVASFLIECLVWNVPNDNFRYSTYVDNVRAVLAHIFNETLLDSSCDKWVEVNGMKWLFRDTQPWTRGQAHSFISAAWDYIGFK